MAKKTLIYWRDIPSQVVVQKGRKREKVLLSTRFQEAVDRAAMRAGKGSSNLYLSEWRRESSQVDLVGDLKSMAEREAERFEEEYSDERLLQLIRNHGSANE